MRPATPGGIGTFRWHAPCERGGDGSRPSAPMPHLEPAGPENRFDGIVRAALPFLVVDRFVRLGSVRHR